MIDNFSRRVLAWKVSGTFDPNATVVVLLTAAQGVSGDKPMLVADGGVENFSGAVDELIASGLLSRVLAQTEITFSNSMIESWWRVLKHRAVCHDLLDFCARVLAILAEPSRELPSARLLGRWGWS